MRKVLGPLVALAMLALAGSALAGPGVNSNGDFLDFSLTASPPVSSTAHTSRGVGFSYSSISGNRINASAESPSTSIQVRLNQNFTINSRFFPACTVNTAGLSSCAKSSQIGTGTAEAELLSKTGGAPTYVPATLEIYNGKPSGTKAPTEIFIASVGGKPVDELDFRIDHKAGGVDFDQIVSPSPAGTPSFYLARFNFTQPDRTVTRTIKRRRVKIHLVTAPRTCHRAWTFSQTSFFSNKPPLVATSSEPCVKG